MQLPQPGTRSTPPPNHRSARPLLFCGAGRLGTIRRPERRLVQPTLGEETQRSAVEGFMELFKPGNIVDLARASEVTGPPDA